MVIHYNELPAPLFTPLLYIQLRTYIRFPLKYGIDLVPIRQGFDSYMLEYGLKSPWLETRTLVSFCVIPAGIFSPVTWLLSYSICPGLCFVFCLVVLYNSVVCRRVQSDSVCVA